MQYGIHSYIFTDRWTDERLGILDITRDLGVEVFEIAVGDDVQFTPELTRQRARALGMTLTISPGGEWPLEYDISSDDPAARESGLAWHENNIDLAAALGAVAYTGALYGHPGVVQRRVPPPDESQRVAVGLHRLADYGEQRGVAIVIEPMSHFRTHLVNTPAQAMQLMQMAEHDNLSLLLDTYHLVTEIRDYRQAILTVQDRLWGVHACENDRGVPGGGLVPWQSIFGALTEIGFDGIILLETYNSAIGDFAFQRGMFHDVCPDPVAYVEEGLAFLRASSMPPN
ncbi:MAG: sugar phosphate isomerase/epimerase family protein [Chloroflexota bacterium]|nr:sugar phosphate isomerase/epimerase family protein [Chloroflexota bacterium]